MLTVTFYIYVYSLLIAQQDAVFKIKFLFCLYHAVGIVLSACQKQSPYEWAVIVTQWIRLQTCFKEDRSKVSGWNSVVFILSSMKMNALFFVILCCSITLWVIVSTYRLCIIDHAAIATCLETIEITGVSLHRSAVNYAIIIKQNGSM